VLSLLEDVESVLSVLSVVISVVTSVVVLLSLLELLVLCASTRLLKISTALVLVPSELESSREMMRALDDRVTASDTIDWMVLVEAVLLATVVDEVLVELA